MVMAIDWRLHRHHRGPQFLIDTTNTGWILLSGQNWIPPPGHQWVLFHGHGQAGRAAGRYDTQAEAHDAARGFAERSGGGEVRDHRKDNNQIRNTDTVGKKDPYPPKG